MPQGRELIERTVYFDVLFAIAVQFNYFCWMFHTGKKQKQYFLFFLHFKYVVLEFVLEI